MDLVQGSLLCSKPLLHLGQALLHLVDRHRLLGLLVDEAGEPLLLVHNGRQSVEEAVRVIDEDLLEGLGLSRGDVVFLEQLVILIQRA